MQLDLRSVVVGYGVAQMSAELADPRAIRGGSEECQPNASDLRGGLIPCLADEIRCELAKTLTATRRAEFDRRKLHYPAHDNQPFVASGGAIREPPFAMEAPPK